MSAMAGACWGALGERFRASSRLTAMVMANHPEAVALFFALSACRAPLILLPPEPRGWRTAPPIPAGTRIVLTRALAHLQADAAALDLDVTTLPESDGPSMAREVPFLGCPGLVFFTSGSTGLPRPVYRRTASLVEASLTLMGAVGLPPGVGVIGALPLDRSFGMNNGLMAATVLGCPLGLLERFEHNALLALFASGEYGYWAGSPVMADVVSRRALAGPHPAPSTCVFAGRLSAPVARAFAAQFGVPPRQLYGTTETLTVTADLAPGPEVRFETIGRPLPGVSVRIGADPHAPSPSAEAGRIWVRSPWIMEGYGFPPDLDREGIVDGWWPSPDIARHDEQGYLTLAGRLDDWIRTGAGHIVNPAEIAALLESYPGVTDAAVVPLDTPAGPVLGALVQSAEPLRPSDLRGHLSRSLPPWARPRVLEAVREFPRLSTGRTDRRACIEILGRALRREHAP
jgi:acyl-CoA synthetase (AMP-forming)/AMP-acid ligase II